MKKPYLCAHTHVYMDETKAFEDKVGRFIRQKALMQRTDKLLVALSGGSDSVALLLVLLRLGYTCEAAHCNFHLRGTESCRDEEFVRRLCQRLGICLHITHFDTRGYAREHHISIEMAARDLRYAWFDRLMETRKAQHVAVAHHEDDSVETFMLNLMRGTGINGLRGIRCRNGHTVRPLLCVGRQDIEQYLNHLGQDWVTDSTNLETDATRNKIRLQLLPLMADINPAVRQNILRTAANLDADAAIYNNGIAEGRRRTLTDDGIDIKALLAEPSPEALLYEVVTPLGFNAAQAADILHTLRDGQSGKVFTSDTHMIVRDRDRLVIRRLEEQRIVQLHLKNVDIDDSFVIPRSCDTACLDADKLKHELHLRPWRQGDWFMPFGMKGRKLVSDFLTDRKMSLADKQHQLVLCCGDDIVWVVGLRPDNRFCISPDSRRAMVISVVHE